MVKTTKFEKFHVPADLFEMLNIFSFFSYLSFEFPVLKIKTTVVETRSLPASALESHTAKHRGVTGFSLILHSNAGGAPE